MPISIDPSKEPPIRYKDQRPEDQHPELTPEAMNNFIDLATEYRLRGKKGLRKKFDELFPPEADSDSTPNGKN